MDEWIKKPRYMHTMEYSSALRKKKKEILQRVANMDEP